MSSDNTTIMLAAGTAAVANSVHPLLLGYSAPYTELCELYISTEMVQNLGHPVFTWLNSVATTLNFVAATIQGWPLIKGSVYCTEAPSLQLLFNIYIYIYI